MFRQRIRNSLLLRNGEFVFEELQPLDQSRKSFLFALVVEAAQALVCLALAAFAIRKLVCREAPIPRRRSRQGRCLRIIFGGTLVVFVFFLVQPCKRFIEFWAIGIIFYSALEKVFADRKVFTLRFDAQRLARLVGIVHRRYTRVPSHVPRRCVPKQQHPWLERRDLSKQPRHSAPLSVLPSRVRLDKKRIGDNGSKPAQRRDESELAEFLAKIEIEFDASEMFLPVKSRKVMFDRQFEQAHHDQYRQRDQASRHNSFP